MRTASRHNETMTETLTIRLASSELNAITSAAQALGQDRSVFIRETILAKAASTNMAFALFQRLGLN